MNNRNAITICIILTILISIPSLMKVPRMLPFLDSEVRSKAPLAIEELRKQGIWMVNAELESITREDNKTCFHWLHHYTQRIPNPLPGRQAGESRVPNPESITTCI